MDIKSVTSNILSLFQSAPETRTTSTGCPSKLTDKQYMKPEPGGELIRNNIDDAIDTTQFQNALALIDSNYNIVFVTGQPVPENQHLSGISGKKAG